MVALHRWRPAAHGSQPVAVKTHLPDASCAGAAVAARDFLTELTLLGRLKHPHLVTLHGVGVSRAGAEGPPRPFLVLEALSGGSLRDLLVRASGAASGVYCQADALKWASQIASLLAYLHSRRPAVVYRDLKAENAMLDDKWDVRVIDLGLSKALPRTRSPDAAAAAAEVYEMTPKTGGVKYMAPEVWRGEPANETVDQYSYAILLWELLSRRGLLFMRTQRQADGSRCEITPAMWAETAAKGGRPPVHSGWPERVRATMLQCWHPQPARRPAFSDVVLALAHLQTPELWTDPRKGPCAAPPEPACACALQ